MNTFDNSQPNAPARGGKIQTQSLSDLVASFPGATPREASDWIAQVVELVAALPRVFSQLTTARVLSPNKQSLRMDDLVEESHPSMSLDLAQLDLTDAKDCAVELDRHLEAAHNTTDHIICDAI